MKTLIIENYKTCRTEVINNVIKVCYDNLAKTLEVSFISDNDNVEINIVIYISDDIRFLIK